MGRATSLKTIIDNEYKRSLYIIDNENNDRKRLWKTQPNRKSPKEAEAKADILVERLSAPSCRNFFLKCVYHLSEADIQNALEYAVRPYVKCPAKYFNRVCKQKLLEKGL